MRTDFFHCLDSWKFLEQSFWSVLDPCIGIATLDSIGEVRSVFQDPGICRARRVVHAEYGFHRRLADRMLAPEWRLFPKRFHRMPKMKGVKRWDATNRGAFAPQTGGVCVFC